jgi:nitrogen fixation NifU-like protein
LNRPGTAGAARGRESARRNTRRKGGKTEAFNGFVGGRVVINICFPFTAKEMLHMEYSEKVIDHFMNPRNVGEVENPSGIGLVGNAKCGDIMKISLKVEDGIITEAKFKTFGCGAAVATSSMATEMVTGKTVQDALTITNKAVMTALDGLPPVKVHCSCLAEEALRAALWDYAQKNGIVVNGLEPPKEDIGHGDESAEDE